MRIYTATEAAEVLRVSKQTVFKLIESGALKAFKVGKLWRITEDAIGELSQQQTRGVRD